MSVSHKPSNVQIFRLVLYQRALHPELFNLHSRRVDRHGDYEVEAWLAPAGHVVRFQVNGDTLTETVLENCEHLPETGLIHALPCLGEKDYEMPRDDDSGRIGYVTTIQTENLSDNLYLATLREMQDFGRETAALTHEWNDAEGTPCLSLLDTQKYRKEFHFQSYHLLGSSGMILRTQSIFEIIR